MSEEESKRFFYVPEKVIAGRTDVGRCDLGWESYPWCEQDGEFRFVTCRFMGKQPLAAGAFERITGYKPTYQMDRAAQLKKEVTRVVEELDNVPTEGFTVVAWNKNPYKFTNGHVGTCSVVVRDPRGFMVGVPTREFFESLQYSSGMDAGCRLKGKYVYAWSSVNKQIALIDASCPELEEWTRLSNRPVKKEPCL